MMLMKKLTSDVFQITGKTVTMATTLSFTWQVRSILNTVVVQCTILKYALGSVSCSNSSTVDLKPDRLILTNVPCVAKNSKQLLCRAFL